MPGCAAAWVATHWLPGAGHRAAGVAQDPNNRLGGELQINRGGTDMQYSTCLLDVELPIAQLDATRMEASQPCRPRHPCTRAIVCDQRWQLSGWRDAEQRCTEPATATCE